MKYRIYTEISGGVTGSRSSYIKSNDKELHFETREKAEEYISELRASRSPYATFHQSYEVEEV